MCIFLQQRNAATELNKKRHNIAPSCKCFMCVNFRWKKWAVESSTTATKLSLHSTHMKEIVLFISSLFCSTSNNTSPCDVSHKRKMELHFYFKVVWLWSLCCDVLRQIQWFVTKPTTRLQETCSQFICNRDAHVLGPQQVALPVRIRSSAKNNHNKVLSHPHEARSFSVAFIKKATQKGYSKQYVSRSYLTYKFFS